MDHTEIIDRLGGIPVLAVALNKHRSRISDWRRNGVPPAAWAALVEVARQQGVNGVTFEVLASGKPTGDVPHLPRGRRRAEAVA